MSLSPEMTLALDHRFKWKLTNVPVLERPVLIIFDYGPSDDAPPLSVAFDSAGHAKCWLSETRLAKIGDNCPRHYPRYKRFVFEGREFHPFSVRAFPNAIFCSIDALVLACQSLYDHVDWN